MCEERKKGDKAREDTREMYKRERYNIERGTVYLTGHWESRSTPLCSNFIGDREEEVTGTTKRIQWEERKFVKIFTPAFGCYVRWRYR